MSGRVVTPNRYGSSRSTRRGLLICAAPITLLSCAALAWAAASRAPASAAGVKMRPLIDLAERAFDRGQFEETEDILRLRLGERADDFRALLLLARVLASTKRTTEAGEVALALARRRDADEIRFTSLLGIVRQLTVDTSNVAALKALALCLRRAGDAMGSIWAAQKALAIEPGDGEMASVMTSAVEAATRGASRPPQIHTGRIPDPNPKPYGRRVR